MILSHTQHINNNIFSLEEIKGLKIKNNYLDNTNLIVEGNNYQSLEALLDTHKGKIDVIHMEVPYYIKKPVVIDNNVNKYTDINKQDNWDVFITKGLELAKELLSENGIIFLFVSNTKISRLKFLSDCILGEDNSLTALKWNRTPTITTLSNKITSSEHILIYAKNKRNIKIYEEVKVDNNNVTKFNLEQCQFNSKPFELLMMLFNKYASKDSIILDLFSNSPTMAQAVLELNKLDNGSRSFILCTNPEDFNSATISREVIYRNLSKIMNGYKTTTGTVVEGLGGNLKFYHRK